LEPEPGTPSLFLQPLPSIDVVRQLPPADVPPPAKNTTPTSTRSDQMERLARQADRQTRHGFELAGRGAYFAARAEFLGSLKVVAEGLDTQQKSDVHGRALAAALTAMREAEDFLPRGSQLEAEPNVAGIAASHATPILKNELKNEQAKITSMTATQRYMTYAQEQFAAAAGQEVAGSVALHALGKLHVAMAKKKVGLIAAAETKAMVFYQASLLADPKNYMAANDLGVLLAQSGNYAEARVTLERSLALSPQSATWHNLAVVYRQMNMPPQADQADQQATAMQQVELARRKQIFGTAVENVRRIDPQTFAQTSSNTPDSPGVTPQPSAQAADSGRLSPTGSAAPSTGATPARPSTAERMSWGSSNQR
jgi:tetratricopeptide (TPR) repeat protein